MQLALDLYASENGEFPPHANLVECDGEEDRDLEGWASSGSDNIAASNDYGPCPENYIVGLVPEYLTALPVDPIDDVPGFVYRSTGSAYKLLVWFSEAEEVEVDNEFARCPADECNLEEYTWCDPEGANSFSKTYAIYNGNFESTNSSENPSCW